MSARAGPEPQPKSNPFEPGDIFSLSGSESLDKNARYCLSLISLLCSKYRCFSSAESIRFI